MNKNTLKREYKELLRDIKKLKQLQADFIKANAKQSAKA